MISNLGDIFNYCNNDLLDGELTDINDVINHFQEATNIISEVSPIEAPMVATILDATCKVTLPIDFLKLDRFMILSESGTIETDLEPIKSWAGEVYFNLANEGRTVNQYYYKKPATLLPTNLAQVPEVDSRYFPSIAQYAAEMFKLKEDDEEAKKQFAAKFYSNLQIYSKCKCITRKIKNVW